jgi:hypothetical protein
MLRGELQNPLIKKKRVKRPTLSVCYRETGATLNNGKLYLKYHKTYKMPEGGTH